MKTYDVRPADQRLIDAAIAFGNRLLAMSQCGDDATQAIQETQRLLRAIPDAIEGVDAGFTLEIRDAWVSDYMDGKIPEHEHDPNREGFFRCWSVNIGSRRGSVPVIEIFSNFNDHPRADFYSDAEAREEHWFYLEAGKSTADWPDYDHRRWIDEATHIERFIIRGRDIEIVGDLSDA